MGSSSTLNVTGPATIVISSGLLGMDSSTSLIVDATGGPVNIYITESTPDATSEIQMDSSSTIHSTTNNPTDITIYVHGEGQVNLDSSSQVYAGIYAPNSAIQLDSSSEIFGAVVGSTVYMDSSAMIHFDEALLRVPSSGGEPQPMEIQSWRIVQ